VIALAAGIPVSLAKDAVAETLIDSSGQRSLTKKDFTRCLNSEFTIQSAGNKVKTKLVRVTDIPRPRRLASDREGFLLLFRGSRSQDLKQGTYIIEHEKLGQFSFLLVPAKDGDESGNHYAATVNRLFG
jgi:hypothetical protein